MPTYEIDAPDGNTYEIDGPPGATKAQITAKVLQRFPQAAGKTQKATAPQEPDAADEYGPLQAAIVGMGRTGDRLYKGAKDLALTIPDKLGHAGAQAERQRMAAEEAENTRLYAKLQGKQPVATFLGEAAPLVAAPMLGTGVGGMALGASLPGLIEYGTPQERLQKGALGTAGGVVGAAAGKALGHIVKPVQTPITQSRTAAVAAAERLGVPLRASEKTGSRSVGWAEAALNDLPFSGGMAQKVEATRQKALNRAAARSLGQNADELTPEVFAAARQKSSAAYDALIGNRQILLDRSFQNEVRAISGSKVMKALRDESVDDLIEPFKNLPAGNVRVTGEWFQQNKTALDNAINSAYTAGQAGKAKALEQFESALERAAARSMTAAEREAFKTVQKQWASLRLLEKGAVVEGGNVLPGRLKEALNTRYKANWKEGKITGDLADIGRMGEVFKPLPQSGTAPRGIYSGVAGGALFAEPMTAATMLAGPAVAQKALQSQAGQRYMTKGLANVTPEMERMLMLLGAGGVSGGLLGAQ